MERVPNPLLTLNHGTNNEASIKNTLSNPTPQAGSLKGFPQPLNEFKDSPGLSKLTSIQANQHTSSKPNLDKLKNDYNSAIIDDMFPVRDWEAEPKTEMN